MLGRIRNTVDTDDTLPLWVSLIVKYLSGDVMNVWLKMDFKAW